MKDLDPTVSLVKIPVSDFPAATAFYRDVLGLHEDFAVEEYGWAQYRAGGIPICLYKPGMGGGAGVPGGDTGLHISVSDAAEAHRRIAKRGGSFPCELTVSDDGGRFFEVADPDGNVIKVCQDPEAAG